MTRRQDDMFRKRIGEYYYTNSKENYEEEEKPQETRQEKVALFLVKKPKLN